MKIRLAALTTGLIALLLFAFGAVTAFADGPQVIVSWKATDSATPAAYPGKALPTIYSTVTASVAVLSNGSPVNLSGQTIYWYLDNDFISDGSNKTSLSFKAVGHKEIMTLRVMLPNYSSGQLISSARIPVVDPKVVIVAPYPGKLFSGSSITAHAEPYFWSATALKTASMQWTVNGQTVTSADDPQNLSVNLNNTAHNFAVTINMFMQKANDPLTNAQSSITLTSQ